MWQEAKESLAVLKASDTFSDDQEVEYLRAVVMSGDEEQAVKWVEDRLEKNEPFDSSFLPSPCKTRLVKSLTVNRSRSSRAAGAVVA